MAGAGAGEAPLRSSPRMSPSKTTASFTPSLSQVLQGWVSLWGFSDVSVSLQETPPSYQLEKMTVPTAVWSGGEDWAADWRDVHLLLPRIAHVVSYVHIADWNHWDFIWGLDAPARLYSHILALMERSR